MEFTNGKMDGFTREILTMTLETEWVNFMMEKNLSTEVFGETDNNLMKKLKIQIVSINQIQKHSTNLHLKFIIEK